VDAGASKDLLQSITHPRPADAFDLYRTPGWATRWKAVAKLEIGLRERKVVELVPAEKPQVEHPRSIHGVRPKRGGVLKWKPVVPRSYRRNTVAGCTGLEPGVLPLLGYLSSTVLPCLPSETSRAASFSSGLRQAPVKHMKQMSEQQFQK
jgi:hypothetical protein